MGLLSYLHVGMIVIFHTYSIACTSRTCPSNRRNYECLLQKYAPTIAIPYTHSNCLHAYHWQTLNSATTLYDDHEHPQVVPHDTHSLDHLSVLPRPLWFYSYIHGKEYTNTPAPTPQSSEALSPPPTKFFCWMKPWLSTSSGCQSKLGLEYWYLASVPLLIN